MITTITGFNGKKNQSTYATALLASMCSLNKGTKTLVLQLTNKDAESVEYFLTGVEKSTVFVKEGLTFMNEGIDGLMRVADNLKLNREDFDQMCLSLRKENRLDIAEVSKSNVFVSNLVARIDNVNQILKNAQEVYDDIFVLLPSDSEEVIKTVNELEVVDRSVYCIKQGYYTKGNIYGEAPILVVMDFDEESKFTIKALRSSMKLGKNVITRKINYNVGAKDAAYMNELLGYMLSNRDIEEEDSNFIWHKDILKVLADILGVNERYLETDYSFEKKLLYGKNLKEKWSVTDHEKRNSKKDTPITSNVKEEPVKSYEFPQLGMTNEEAESESKEIQEAQEAIEEMVIEEAESVLEEAVEEILKEEASEEETIEEEILEESLEESQTEETEDETEEEQEQKAPERKLFGKKKDRKKKRQEKN